MTSVTRLRLCAFAGSYTDYGSAVLVHTSTSILFAWSTYLVVDSAFAAFGECPGFQPHGWTKFYVIATLPALEFVCAIYAFATSEGDLVASMTMTGPLWPHSLEALHRLGTLIQQYVPS
ncbi:hypothetical protein FRB95_007000 [Tulasnella sp. JGI-2019a]|nr:hypothetical protein FRB95_007000 [Tulasnella sp. JGI-2019a]